MTLGGCPGVGGLRTAPPPRRCDRGPPAAVWREHPVGGAIPVRRVFPGDIFCNSFIAGRCVAQFDAVPFYYDDDHLSDEGARYLVDQLLVKINAR